MLHGHSQIKNGYKTSLGIPFKDESKGSEGDSCDKIPVRNKYIGAHAGCHGEFGQYIETSKR